MDLIDQINKLIKVRIEELESKNSLYYILRQWCKFIWIFLDQYYIPDESQWSIRFLKNVLSGKTIVTIKYI